MKLPNIALDGVRACQCARDYALEEGAGLLLCFWTLQRRRSTARKCLYKYMLHSKGLIRGDVTKQVLVQGFPECEAGLASHLINATRRKKAAQSTNTNFIVLSHSRRIV